MPVVLVGQQMCDSIAVCSAEFRLRARHAEHWGSTEAGMQVLLHHAGTAHVGIARCAEYYVQATQLAENVLAFVHSDCHIKSLLIQWPQTDICRQGSVHSRTLEGR